MNMRAGRHTVQGIGPRSEEDATIEFQFNNLAKGFHNILIGAEKRTVTLPECGIEMIRLDHYYVTERRRKISYFQSYVLQNGAIESHLRALLNKIRNACVKEGEIEPIKDAMVSLYISSSTGRSLGGEWKKVGELFAQVKASVS